MAERGAPYGQGQDGGVDPQRSALAEYRARTVGTGSLTKLLAYELWAMLLADLNGAIGFLGRRLFIKPLLGIEAKGLILGRRVTFRGVDRIRIGAYTRIDEGCLIDCFPPAEGISIGPNCLLERNVTLSTGPLAGASICLGRRVSLGVSATLVAHTRIEIGNDVMIGPLSYITAGSHVYARLDIPMVEQGHAGRGVRIGDDVWLGAGVTILDGVTIGSGVIVGAGSVVTHDVPERCIVAGVPARVLRWRDEAVAERVWE